MGDRRAFYFSGAGQFGDQGFDATNAENGRVRDHKADGHAFVCCGTWAPTKCATWRN